MNRWRAVFVAAMMLALVAGYLLRDTPGYMVRNPDDSISGDITQYVYWTRLVTLGGIQSAYSGSWPETYSVYPPVTMYPYQIVGNVYRWLQDPTFDSINDQKSLWLHEAIKLVALVWHLLTGAAIFLFVRRVASGRAAAVAASLYVLNPAALYDVAHWAQPDGAHSLFSVLAIGFLSLGQVLPAWAAIAGAALAKPQAWSILPLFALATLRGHGSMSLGRGLVAGAIVGAVVCLPFAASGRLLELLSLPRVISSVMPVVSADAHNVWWVVFQSRGVDPLFELDSTHALGPLSYRVFAGILVGAVIIFTCWLYWTRRTSLAEAAALGVLGWFTFTTQAHENHLFFALPLLSLAWPMRPWLLVPFGILSVTLLMNMLLHDWLVLQALGFGLLDPLVQQARLANAATNTLCCLAWSLLCAVRAPDPTRSLGSREELKPPRTMLGSASA